MSNFVPWSEGAATLDVDIIHGVLFRLLDLFVSHPKSPGSQAKSEGKLTPKPTAMIPIMGLALLRERWRGDGASAGPRSRGARRGRIRPGAHASGGEKSAK